MKNNHSKGNSRKSRTEEKGWNYLVTMAGIVARIEPQI